MALRDDCSRQNRGLRVVHTAQVYESRVVFLVQTDLNPCPAMPAYIRVKDVLDQ